MVRRSGVLLAVGVVTMLSAAPVRQSDHGTSVNSETAATFMTIVPIMRHKRFAFKVGFGGHDVDVARRVTQVNCSAPPTL